MITLHSSGINRSTMLSNLFIDQFMPKANGEFVKVYIYLLRRNSMPGVSLGLAQMADSLLCTEGDILRALKYWESENLVSLSYEGTQLTGITLLSPEEKNIPEMAATSSNLVTEPMAASAIPKIPSQPEIAASPEALDIIFTASPESASRSPSETKSLTLDRVKELKQNEEIVQLLYIAEQYLGKTLTPTETRKILFFYDELHMSVDLIDYLIEYCVGRDHRSIRYIETVAMAWKEEGITTVEMAKDSTARYGKDYFTILKFMGITNRNPVDTEIVLMNTWMKDYGFTMDLIQEACSRTVLQTGQPSFQYADKILQYWKKKEIRSLEDVRLQDAAHQKRKLEKAAAKPVQPKSNNRFNNFHQREYDFTEYEKKLLNQ